MRLDPISSLKSPARSSLLIGLFSGLGLVAGCADRAVSPEQPPEASEQFTSDALHASHSTAERRALSELTRAVALALADDRARHLVLGHMRASRHTAEHKLEFSRYLGPKGGGHLLDAMARVTGTSRDSLLRLVSQVRPLEFYMPIRHQRDRWAGGTDVVVASLLEDEDTPVVFDLKGSPINVEPDAVPPLPTLALVPVETDFWKPLSAGVENVTESNAAAIGTWASAPTATTPGLSPSYLRMQAEGGITSAAVTPTSPSGLYMTYTDLDDDGEGSLKGQPEIEAYVVGPSPIDPANALRVITCAGESESYWRNFNQDANSWSGQVMLLDQRDLDRNQFIDTLPDNRTFSVILYEDDDERCIIKDDPMRLTHHLEWLSYAGFVGYKLVQLCQEPDSNDTTCGLGFWGVIFWVGDVLWSMIQTNDDYIGLAIEKDKIQGFSHSIANYALIVGDTALAGGIKLEFHHQTLVAGIMGPDYVYPDDVMTWYATAGGGTPPYSYVWSGPLSGTQSSVSGSVRTSRTLYLDVYDAAGGHVTATKFITVQDGDPCGHELC